MRMSKRHLGCYFLLEFGERSNVTSGSDCTTVTNIFTGCSITSENIVSSDQLVKIAHNSRDSFTQFNFVSVSFMFALLCLG